MSWMSLILRRSELRNSKFASLLWSLLLKCHPGLLPASQSCGVGQSLRSQSKQVDEERRKNVQREPGAECERDHRTQRGIESTGLWTCRVPFQLPFKEHGCLQSRSPSSSFLGASVHGTQRALQKERYGEICGRVIILENWGTKLLIAGRIANYWLPIVYLLMFIHSIPLSVQHTANKINLVHT